MEKPQIILTLEKELNCSFNMVGLNEIEVWKTKRTAEYSIDENGNITGLAICNYELMEIHHIISQNVMALNYLTSLSLRGNKISDISPLINLPGIQKLYMGGNKISDISPLKSLKNLEILHLSSNQICDISPLKDLVNLQKLNLGNNQIIEISSLQNLLNLERLDIQINQVKILPEWITEFPKMAIRWKDMYGDNPVIALYDNPIENIPLEIIKQGKDAIRNFFRQLKKEKEQRYLFESKLLILGEGGVGKTSFARKLKDSEAVLPNENETTFGIDVSNWNFTIQHPALGERTMFTNIWDFGGQKLYQGTHQLFFSDKSFYVLIDDAREEKTDFSYWLNTIAQLAGNESKVLIVTNKKQTHVPQIDKNGLLGHFGDLIAGFVEIDLKNDTRDIIKLQNTVKQYLQNLPEIGSTLPASWVKIREDLFHENKNFISYDCYLEICKNSHTDLAAVNFLSEYFNRVGVFTHYYNDDLLRERVYLNSNWLVNTIYQILNHQLVKDKKGRLTEMDVKEIWSGNELFNETSKLTRLMHQFGLMYEIPDRKEFVVPAHLQANKPYIEWPYEAKHAILQFVYEFDQYMPKGIMSQLIVALHRYIVQHEMVWQKGLNINYNSTFAEISETYDKRNKYIIRLFGNEKKELLGIINSKFEEILAPFLNLQYEKLVPCICSVCKKNVNPNFYKYSKLKEIESRGKRNTVICDETDEEISLKELLDGVNLIQKKASGIKEIEYNQGQDIIVQLLEKKFFLEKELITTYDSEKKFALQEKIKELNKQIDELKSTI